MTLNLGGTLITLAVRTIYLAVGSKENLHNYNFTCCCFVCCIY